MKSLKIVFWALVVLFVLIISYLVVPASIQVKRGLFPLMAFLAIAFFLSGGALIFLTIKTKVKGMLKKFLILTGASATGFFISIILHNLVYGLFIYLFGPDFWDKIGLSDEPLFFFLAIIICPLGFLIGMIGSIIMFIKNKRNIKKYS